MFEAEQLAEPILLCGVELPASEATMFEDLIDVCNRIYNNNHLNPTDNADETETDESDASAKEEAAAHV